MANGRARRAVAKRARLARSSQNRQNRRLSRALRLAIPSSRSTRHKVDFRFRTAYDYLKAWHLFATRLLHRGCDRTAVCREREAHFRQGRTAKPSGDRALRNDTKGGKLVRCSLLQDNRRNPQPVSRSRSSLGRRSVLCFAGNVALGSFRFKSGLWVAKGHRKTKFRWSVDT